jgi:hypothetical protein
MVVISGAGKEDDAAAAEACKTISSEADKLLAEGKNTADALKNIPFYSVFNPNNYKAENESVQKLRQITKIDLSDNDIYDLQNNCVNNFTQSGTNEIDMEACNDPVLIKAWGEILNGPFCQKNPSECPKLSMNNITQENINTAQGTCIMSNLMDIARKREATVNTAAIVEANQKALNLAANKSNTDTCQYVSTNMSSNRYIKVVNECANKVNQTGRNTIKGCIPMWNISQKNTNSAIQDCMLTNEAIIKTEDSTNVVQSLVAKITQYAEGINPMASSASSLSCIIMCVICLVACFLMMGGAGGGGPNAATKDAATSGVLNAAGKIGASSMMSGLMSG